MLFWTAAASLSRTITRVVRLIGGGRGLTRGGGLIPVCRWRPEDSKAFSLLLVNKKGWYWFPSTTMKTNVAFTFRVGALPLSLFKSIYASKQPSQSITWKIAHLTHPVNVDIGVDTQQPLWYRVHPLTSWFSNILATPLTWRTQHLFIWSQLAT